MNIALLGYGKMGHAIEAIAIERGHTLSFIADAGNADYSPDELQGSEVAIEFSRPESAVANIIKCFEAGIPVVVGTTGWYGQWEKVEQACLQHKGALLCATNFSIGVNIFFEINRKLALLMNRQPEYEVALEEIHHTLKLDSPSGTAITLAEDIISRIDRKESWKEGGEAPQPAEINIFSQRIENIPGTHIVRYSSEIDDIELKHTAHNRKGFASGALIAAEWIQGKTGIFTLKDLLQL